VLAFVTPSLVDKLGATHLPIVLISSSELAGQNGRNCISTLHNIIMASNPADAPAVKIRQDDTATLLYSSGTTGASKGVICTHKNLISLLCILLSRLRLNYEYLYLCTVPMFHVYGLSAFACGLLGSGSTIVVLSKFDVVEMLAAVEKYRVTYLPIVPPILLAMTKTDIAKKYDLSSLHTVICGGAPISKESAQEFVSRFPSVSLLQVTCFALFSQFYNMFVYLI
jgi:OPC-8:0 CoA ligase-1